MAADCVTDGQDRDRGDAGDAGKENGSVVVLGPMPLAWAGCALSSAGAASTSGVVASAPLRKARRWVVDAFGER
jgi:hypothetical protein